MTTETIPVAPELPHPLGRRGAHHDPRNWDHRALVLPPPRVVAKVGGWWTGTVFDQGQESRCTTEAAVGSLVTNPNRPAFKADFALLDSPDERQAFYRASQALDPWEGEDYEGTSTDAPFKLLRDRGLIA